MQEIMIKPAYERFRPVNSAAVCYRSYGLLEENQERLFRKAQKVRRKITEAMEECSRACMTRFFGAGKRLYCAALE